MNHNLYRLSQGTIDLPYQRRRKLFTSADGYFYDSIMNSKADIIINIDEDAFVTNNGNLKDLLEYFLDNEYVNCGVPDGGVIPIRHHNPLITNPFFNIINVSKIRKKFRLKEIINNYSTHKIEFEEFAPLHLLNTDYQFDYFEPYYPFFVWLTVNYKTLFLNAEEHTDEISTIVKNHDNEPFLSHSWYSRNYGLDKYHTTRINNLVMEAMPNVEIKEEMNTSCRISKIYERIGYKYYYPLKYKLERKMWNL